MKYIGDLPKQPSWNMIKLDGRYFTGEMVYKRAEGVYRPWGYGPIASIDERVEQVPVPILEGRLKLIDYNQAASTSILIFEDEEGQQWESTTGNAFEILKRKDKMSDIHATLPYTFKKTGDRVSLCIYEEKV